MRQQTTNASKYNALPVPTLDRFILRPFFAQVGSSWRSWAPSWLIFALLGRILSPRWRNITPRWANIAPRCAKIAPKRPQIAPARPPKTSKSDGGLFVFRLSLFFQRSHPRSQKSRQAAPQKASSWQFFAPRWSSWCHLALQVGHLGSILAPSWSS